MFDGAGDFSGKVTFVTGPGKDSGKTTFLNHALYVMRRDGAGEPCAFLSVGFDGEGRDSLTRARKPIVTARPGDVVVSSERYLRASHALFEIVDLVPGSTALGRLAIARARREGAVTLVGPEGNASAAAAVAAIRDASLARTVFVDGAINRITQISSFRGASFAYAVRAGKDNLDRAARQVRLMRLLVSLREPESDDPGLCRVAGALTAETVHSIPREARTVVVEDLTKVFLDEREISAAFPASGERTLRVGFQIDFAGFCVALKGVSRDEFADRIGGNRGDVAFNPYETEALGA